MNSLRCAKIIINLVVATTLMLSLFAVHACRTTGRVPVDTQIKLSQPWVFNVDFQKAIYKTNMMIYGKEITGLTIIKKTGSSFRLVFMSEIGLKYFDMEFFLENNRIVTHYIISVLNKKPVLKMLSDNFSLLFMIFPEKVSEEFYQDAMTNNMIKEYSSKGHRSKYIFDPNFGMASSIHYKNKGRNIIITVNITDNLAPQTINFNQPGFNLRMERL